MHAGIDAMAHFDIKEAAAPAASEEHSQLEADIASWFDPAVEESMREETHQHRVHAPTDDGLLAFQAEVRGTLRRKLERRVGPASKLMPYPSQLAFSPASVYRALDWAVLALTRACDEYAAGEWGCWRYTVALGYVVVVNPLLFQVTRLMYSARDDGGSTGSMWRLPLALGVLWGIWSDVALETSEEHFVASAASCLAQIVGAAMVWPPRRADAEGGSREKAA